MEFDFVDNACDHFCLDVWLRDERHYAVGVYSSTQKFGKLHRTRGGGRKVRGVALSAELD